MTTRHPAQRDAHDELPQPVPPDGAEPVGPEHPSRRRFLGYVLAAPLLATAAEIGTAPQAQAAPGAPGAPRVQAPKGRPIPSNLQIPEYYEFVDVYRDSCRLTNALLRVEIGENGRPSFAIPRSDNGQGIVTSFAMIIAEEMDIDPDDVDVTLAPARPELIFNQLTGGSSSTYSLMQPVRVAAALAKGQLLDAAANLLEQDRRTLTTLGLKIADTTGKAIGFGELTKMAASSVTKPVEVLLKPRKEFKVIGKSKNKKDQRAIATGEKQFINDMKIPDAMPVVIARAPDLNGFPSAEQPAKLNAVMSMPGVLDVKMIGTGAAIRAETFGQAFEAVNALQPQMKWNAGTVPGKSDSDLIPELKRSQMPLVVPAVPGRTIEQEFVHYARNGSALEPNCAIVAFDAEKGTAEVWGPSKSPINHSKIVSQRLGIQMDKVKFNVIEGGGSFGRKLFGDYFQEAADCAKAFGKPVKLLYDRAADCRQGRVKPLATTKIRATLTKDSVASFEMRYGGVNMEVDEGFVDTITSQAIKAPLGNLAVSEVFWEISVLTPYNFGVNTRLMNETNYGFKSGSTRNVYGPDTCTAREVMVDKIAEKLGRDPMEFRAEFVKTDRAKRVIERAAKEANWGKKMAPGTAQGIAIHEEYKAVTVCIAEIDCRPETVNRNVDNVSNPQESSSGSKTGPRVTKITFVVDPGLLINPRGYEAQMMGGINDGIANAMTAGLHFENGHFVEASWDNYFYTRQWNTPLDMNIIVLEDSEQPDPAGAGEAGVPATMAATVNAFRRATGTEPDTTPVLHNDPLPFKEIPTTPSIPPSPDNALEGLR